jgi:hypothetical protein
MPYLKVFLSLGVIAGLAGLTAPEAGPRALAPIGVAQGGCKAPQRLHLYQKANSTIIGECR